MSQEAVGGSGVSPAPEDTRALFEQQLAGPFDCGGLVNAFVKLEAEIGSDQTTEDNRLGEVLGFSERARDFASASACPEATMYFAGRVANYSGQIRALTLEPGEAQPATEISEA